MLYEERYNEINQKQDSYHEHIDLTEPDHHYDESTIQQENPHEKSRGHDHPGHQDHGDMVKDFKKRFFISLILTLLILALSPMIQHFLGVDWRFDNDMYLLFGL